MRIKSAAKVLIFCLVEKFEAVYFVKFNKKYRKLQKMAFFTFWNVECEMAGVHMCYFATTIANVGRAAWEFLDVRCLTVENLNRRKTPSLSSYLVMGF